MLQGGRWGDRQVLPESWVRESTAPPPTPAPRGYFGDELLAHSWPGLYYAYLWWGMDRGNGRYDFAARGNHGQMIFVSPDSGVVIVRNGTRYGAGRAEWVTMAAGLAQAVRAKTAR
jgi:hypothetical protein